MTKRPQSNLDLIRRVLGDDYLELELKHLSIEEDIQGESPAAPGDAPADAGSVPEILCTVVVETVDTRGDSSKVEGKGRGMVDALFNGLLGRYAVEYQSLKSIELVDFRVEGKLGTKQAKSGGDAMATVTVDVRNSENLVFSFSDESRSVALSSARAVLAIAEYFVNAERAFIMLYKSRKDAQDRNRHDLVGRYTREMAEVVNSTSYAEVIETIKKEMD